MPSPDYDGYAKSLEAIRDGVLRDYWAGILDINRHQLNVGRTYLWVAAALVGAYGAAFDRYHAFLLESRCAVVFGGISGLLAAIAFGVCLYAIPARKGYRAIPEKGWGEFSAEAYKLLKTSRPQVYSSFLSGHIAKIDYAYAHNFRTNRSRARILRVTSWLMIASFVLAIVTTVLTMVQATIQIPTEETTMSKATTPSDPAPDPAPAEPQVDVPEPPPPADIGGSDMSTHSEPPNTATTFLTEGDDYGG